VLREREPPRVFEAPDDRFAAGFRAAVERLAPPVEDLARDAVDFFAVLRFAVLRFAVERFAEDLRAPVLRAEEAEDEPELARPLALVSAVHFPDMTRCAASATASAINVPSLVALAITLVAAWLAVSAASRPASRIALRALGLALIAAAAAARPAASISLLIAALASLSTLLSRPLEEEPEDPLLEDLLRADLAIASSPLSRKRHFSAVTVPE
jgi:hypothetical protein